MQSSATITLTRKDYPNLFVDGITSEQLEFFLRNKIELVSVPAKSGFGLKAYSCCDDEEEITFRLLYVKSCPRPPCDD